VICSLDQLFLTLFLVGPQPWDITYRYNDERVNRAQKVYQGEFYLKLNKPGTYELLQVGLGFATAVSNPDKRKTVMPRSGINFALVLSLTLARSALNILENLLYPFLTQAWIGKQLIRIIELRSARVKLIRSSWHSRVSH
jgi:hypothetical protein